MAIYSVPLRDMRFVLHELLDVERHFAEVPEYAETTADLVDAVLGEAAKFCEAVIFPLNRRGDEEGCHFENGVVRTPAGFKQAYQAYREGGWTSLACAPEHGGQGLPQTVGLMVDEMVGSANMAFGLYTILSHGAYIALNESASDELKQTYLPKLADGRWSGTMCLTEPQCGTDLGLTRTKAVPLDDGSWSVSGTKIFITGGEHDLTENIVHLVLATTPDAPPGIKGISMFLVPKFLPSADSSPGPRNGVACGSIEHKMGIRGASTCVLNFDEATGYLVGELHRGMRTMFRMMNHERVVVGLQGLSQAEVAYQSAVAYARERRQGRAPGEAGSAAREATPIIAHPDVRRMLLTTRAYNEGARALAAWTALRIDISHRHPDAAVREQADDLVALLTPVIKGFFTDTGSESCNACLQVFGGHGYINEWGMEQLVRDVRITQIYEGTNGVQALDLVGRKLGLHGGRPVTRYLELIEAFVEEHRGDRSLDEFVEPLVEAVSLLKSTTASLVARDDVERGAASSEYLRLMGLVSFAYMWALMARTALAKLDGRERAFYDAKLTTARFFMQRLLPHTHALAAVIDAGGQAMMALPEESF